MMFTEHPPELLTPLHIGHIGVSTLICKGPLWVQGLIPSQSRSQYRISFSFLLDVLGDNCLLSTSILIILFLCYCWSMTICLHIFTLNALKLSVYALGPPDNLSKVTALPDIEC